jgi:hypothetical protein
VIVAAVRKIHAEPVRIFAYQAIVGTFYLELLTLKWLKRKKDFFPLTLRIAAVSPKQESPTTLASLPSPIDAKNHWAHANT